MTATLDGPLEPLPATLKRRKLAWFRHVTRDDSLCKPVPQGKLGLGFTSRPVEEKQIGQ
ncbi:hypothetical protein DPMN_007233 [Dreissena polymorpha]|uniref:Uncharacterized protein n=1 Tax=Dreissena polymorpha TaxID=45954 RepID=A0A9D4MTB8_DREPO|nr:hypothetical protein DPMN_007233 [Dreissena polymorpha]